MGRLLNVTDSYSDVQRGYELVWHRTAGRSGSGSRGSLASMGQGVEVNGTHY